MIGKKQWWKSKGVLGSILVIAAVILQYFGVDLGEEERSKITELVLQITAAVGALIALIGRVTAKKRIGKEEEPFDLPKK